MENEFNPYFVIQLPPENLLERSTIKLYLK